jgi:predicted acyl esterase
MFFLSLYFFRRIFCKVIVRETVKYIVEGRMLTYTSPLLKHDLTVIGPVKAILYAKSSALDTDWVVRLVCATRFCKEGEAGETKQRKRDPSVSMALPGFRRAREEKFCA